ncbi:hypothetical protein [Streptomyces hiroshimensis]|uniref:Aminoglycoside phosphotransferase domain-containing protein n=1 Tax=Streptomyces hiroshimensis TaxID=66424 RepID=A0ABQ2Z4W1_9ACTN|nr:hypothetical protein [Streptomyces hiroshimensis]GGY05099.1 hypothetical protein GCM10010324_59810 [Streptomyces hiroshimensis]
MTPPDDAGELVGEYVTGLQHTRVHRSAHGGFVWWHRPGALRPRPLAAPAAAAVPDLSGVPGAALLVTPVSFGDGLLHHAPGAVSAVTWLADPRPGARQLAAHALAAAGRSLRALHGTPLPPGLPPGPPESLRRMRAWADGADGADGLLPGAARLREVTLAAWGSARLERVRAWWEEAVEPPVPSLIHGGASLGALIPPLHRGRTALLTGEDLAAGSPALDLGWLLGDLAELAWSAGRYGSDDTVGGPDLRQVLLAGYGPGPGGGPDPAAVARAAVLRVVTHMQDFASYCDWSEELHDYIAFTAELIDEEGRRAVPGGTS